MNIACYFLTEGKLELAQIPDTMLSELCQSLRANGVETVHFADRSIQVEGVYIPAKGSKKMLIVLPSE